MAVEGGAGLDSELLADTGEASGSVRLGGRERVAALTLIHHPDVRRVGERALLPELDGDGEVGLSRLEPAFGPPGETPGRPLSDRFVSRNPLVLRGSGDGGVLLSEPPEGVAVFVDGAALKEQAWLSTERLDEGVVLDFASRAVLLLHRVSNYELPARKRGLIGASDEIEALRREIEKVADLDVPLLLRGETGTGKELVSRAVHRASRRASGPFVAVNMGALAPDTAASEIFGHARGAFTGGEREHCGLFERADSGTLLLDEVGEAPADVQVMLLRALETSMVTRLGSETPRVVDVRVVAASDADLEAAAAGGRFRGPLLHRLSGYVVDLPPLRARRDDIGRLLVSFLLEAVSELGKDHPLDDPKPGPRLWLPTALVSALARHPWPGNVRQLKNVARQLVIAGRGSEEVTVNAEVRRLFAEVPRPRPLESPPSRGAAPPGRRPSDLSDEDIAAALEEHAYSVPAAARALGVSRQSLYTRIEASSVLRLAGDLRPQEIVIARARHGGDLDAAAADLKVSAKALLERMKELGLS